MNAETSETIPRVQSPVRRPSRWARGLRVVCLIVICLLLSAAVMVVGGLWRLGLMPAGATSAASHDVVGDLGGMAVTMPTYVPHLVEYDGDPGWAPRPGWRPPERTHASRLNSFGVYVRYPDMATLSTPELKNEFRQKKLYDHNWLSLIIESGDRYPGHGFLDRLYAAELVTPDPDRPHKQYGEPSSSVSGLRLYAKQGTNQQTGRPYRYEWSDGDIFVGFDSWGRVTTLIRCSFRSGTDVYATCKQSWSMESFGLSITMGARYAPVLLPHWHDIQTRTSQFVLGFKDPTATPDPSSPR